MHGDPMKEKFGDSVDLLELRITEALEQAPAVTVPEGFAARLVSRLPKQAAAALPRSYFGYAGVAASLVVLLAAMAWLAPRAAGQSLYWMGLEWSLCAQFCLSAVWLGLRGSRME